jgi:hypothetical protein
LTGRPQQQRIPDMSRRSHAHCHRRVRTPPSWSGTACGCSGHALTYVARSVPVRPVTSPDGIAGGPVTQVLRRTRSPAQHDRWLPAREPGTCLTEPQPGPCQDLVTVEQLEATPWATNGRNGVASPAADATPRRFELCRTGSRNSHGMPGYRRLPARLCSSAALPQPDLQNNGPGVGS